MQTILKSEKSVFACGAIGGCGPPSRRAEVESTTVRLERRQTLEDQSGTMSKAIVMRG